MPDLNANKVPMASTKDMTRKSDYTHLTPPGESFHKFTTFDDESQIESVTQHSNYGARCHDFEMTYD